MQMRLMVLAFLVVLLPGAALAGSGGSLSGGSTAGHLESPSYGTLGKTSSTHVTTIAPRRVLAPAGALGTESDDFAPGRSRADKPRLLERRLDCFDDPVTPDRDTRNRFTSRCPGNAR